LTFGKPRLLLTRRWSGQEEQNRCPKDNPRHAIPL
jgi:hypothetical protein